MPWRGWKGGRKDLREMDGKVNVGQEEKLALTGVRIWLQLERHTEPRQGLL